MTTALVSAYCSPCTAELRLKVRNSTRNKSVYVLRRIMLIAMSDELVTVLLLLHCPFTGLELVHGSLGMEDMGSIQNEIKWRKISTVGDSSR